MLFVLGVDMQFDSDLAFTSESVGIPFMSFAQTVAKIGPISWLVPSNTTYPPSVLSATPSEDRRDIVNFSRILIRNSSFLDQRSKENMEVAALCKGHRHGTYWRVVDCHKEYRLLHQVLVQRLCLDVFKTAVYLGGRPFIFHC